MRLKRTGSLLRCAMHADSADLKAKNKNGIYNICIIIRHTHTHTSSPFTSNYIIKERLFYIFFNQSIQN